MLMTALLLATDPAQEAAPAPTPPPAVSRSAQTRHSAPTSGPAVTRMFSGVYPNWTPICDAAGIAGHWIAFDLTLDSDGRIIAGPTLVRPEEGPEWRAAAETARQALLRSAPFDVPAGFPGGEYRPVFRTDRACAALTAPDPDED